MRGKKLMLKDSVAVTTYLLKKVYERVRRFRFRNEYKTEAAAIRDLIMEGLKHLDSENEPNEGGEKIGRKNERK